MGTASNIMFSQCYSPYSFNVVTKNMVAGKASWLDSGDKSVTSEGVTVSSDHDVITEQSFQLELTTETVELYEDE